MGFWGISGGFFRGLECGLCLKMLFNDVLLVILNIMNIVICDIILFYF